MAFAAAEFTESVLEARSGATGKIECAYVQSEETEAKYFATPLLLGVSVCVVVIEHSLTLKTPKKPASENVVCLCRLLIILANISNLFFAYRQTVWTQVRLRQSGSTLFAKMT